ncbi:hypothetical protein [Streptomyces sp. NBC_01304]|uniref:hypothetical protein n=1 Tax=Streptomyces sp. NBC_01304 TaxID=2903818 RepID=UPI002E0E3EE0|nr:hypothetical protein OG430_46080 [Streptomyces sp. NBC_01304]
MAPYDLLPAPPTAHGLTAPADSVVLLTVVERHGRPVPARCAREGLCGGRQVRPDRRSM